MTLLQGSFFSLPFSPFFYSSIPLLLHRSLSLQGLAVCTKLEELTIDRNLLQDLQLVQYFPHLKWLSVSGNRLTSLLSAGTMTVLGKLEYLNISWNSLQGLQGIEVRGK